MKQVSIKTSQYIPMFSIFVLDGEMLQKDGVAGEYDLCSVIDWDDDAELFPFDADAVQKYNDDEYVYE